MRRTCVADDSDDGQQGVRSTEVPSQGRRQQWGGTGATRQGPKRGGGSSRGGGGNGRGGGGGGGGSGGAEGVEDGFDFETARAGLPGLDMGMQGVDPNGYIHAMLSPISCT